MVLLLDIEGTTTDIRFVHDVLFPLSYDALPAWLRAHRDDPDVARALAATGAAGPDALCEILRGWIREDRKETVLKQIQGRIWRDAYAGGQLRAHVYDDVRPAFERWTAAGHRVAIFSSGSVEAQKLLFRFTIAGDLTPFLSAYFDTTTGPKRHAESYAAIAAALGVSPGGVWFLSDVEAELDAAAAAGTGTLHVLRPGHPPASTRHPTAPDFTDVG